MTFKSIGVVFFLRGWEERWEALQEDFLKQRKTAVLLDTLFSSAWESRALAPTGRLEGAMSSIIFKSWGNDNLSLTAERKIACSGH